MSEPDQVRISDTHYSLIAENGERVAVIATVNLDAELIAGVATFYRYADTYVVESCYPNQIMDRVDLYHQLLTYHGDDSDVVRKFMSELIASQERSDDATRFTWEFITGVDAVRNDSDLRDVLETVVEPERLDPPFDVPDDGSVVTLDISYDEHDVLTEANERYGSSAVRFERFRGTTYVFGLTSDLAGTLSKGCFKLKQEYKEMDFHDSVATADRVEGIILSAGKGESESPEAPS